MWLGWALLTRPRYLRALAIGHLQKPLPGNGGKLPVIGLGTWQTFNVGSDSQLLDARTEVVKAFFEEGGGMVDSSPMYGSAPDVMGYALKRLGKPDTLFSAEKVWSPAGGTTQDQVDQLSERWGVDKFDLVQVHNLTDWQKHLEALQGMKADGKRDYVGITTFHGLRHDQIERIMESEDIDFVQLTELAPLRLNSKLLSVKVVQVQATTADCYTCFLTPNLLTTYNLAAYFCDNRLRIEITTKSCA